MDWGLALPEEHRVKMVGSGEHTGPLAGDFPRWVVSLNTVAPLLCRRGCGEHRLGAAAYRLHPRRRQAVQRVSGVHSLPLDLSC
eukprot:COSAG04_NODE_1541_length_6419_cov_3.373259_5_plen_84_part_00